MEEAVTAAGLDGLLTSKAWSQTSLLLGYATKGEK